MFRTKICGITNVDDAQTVASAGAGAIGLNFYARSPRYVERDIARRIVHSLPQGVVKVGVFVNSPVEQIVDTFEDLKLDLVQLHGDEPPEFLQQLAGRPVMRAFRAGSDLSPIRQYLDRCRQLGCLPQMILVDAHCPGSYGGTGQTANWSALATATDVWGELPLVLAGGLNAINVAASIEAVRPAAVDTASGVELSPGKKSAEQVAAFVWAAEAAFTKR